MVNKRSFDISDDARAKMHVDLYIHQNVLLWSRFQSLYWIEGAFYAAAYYSGGDVWILTGILLVSTALLGYLYLVNYADMRLRNLHRRELQLRGFNPTPPLTPKRWQPLTRLWEPLSNVTLFGGLVALNFLVAFLMAGDFLPSRIGDNGPVETVRDVVKSDLQDEMASSPTSNDTANFTLFGVHITLDWSAWRDESDGTKP
jgi:hypothetical protein